MSVPDPDPPPDPASGPSEAGVRATKRNNFFPEILLHRVNRVHAETSGKEQKSLSMFILVCLQSLHSVLYIFTLTTTPFSFPSRTCGTC